MTALAQGNGQRRAALLNANATRFAKATTKRHLAQFKIRQAYGEAATVLVDQSHGSPSMRVYEFLLAIPGVGEAKVHEILAAKGAWPIWPLRRLEQLTDNQRLELAERLRARA